MISAEPVLGIFTSSTPEDDTKKCGDKVDTENIVAVEEETDTSYNNGADVFNFSVRLACRCAISMIRKQPTVHAKGNLVNFRQRKPPPPIDEQPSVH